MLATEVSVVERLPASHSQIFRIGAKNWLSKCSWQIAVKYMCVLVIVSDCCGLSSLVYVAFVNDLLRVWTEWRHACK